MNGRRLVRERSLVWAARALWAALPVTIGTPLGAALRDWETLPRTAVSGALWIAWLGTLVATLVPHPIALTVWRVAAPAAAGAVAWAAVDGHGSVLAVLNVATAVGLAFAPVVASVCINGPAYANERRYALRPPGVALIGLAAGAWLGVVGGPVAALVLLTNRHWIAGAIAAVVGAPLAALGARALHGQARRWLVIVPAGVVVHDPMTLADPVLFKKTTVERITPALAESPTPRTDLTAGALGLAVEVRLKEATDVLVITRAGRRPVAEIMKATALLIAPTRPAALLADVAGRGYRVG